MVANENCPSGNCNECCTEENGYYKLSAMYIMWWKGFYWTFLVAVQTRRVWRILENLISTSCETASNIKITENRVLFGVITDNIFDLIILLAKQYLYRCKFEQSVPLVSVFRKQLKLRHKLEEYNSKITFQENAFNARWHCYRPLLLED